MLFRSRHMAFGLFACAYHVLFSKTLYILCVGRKGMFSTTVVVILAVPLLALRLLTSNNRRHRPPDDNACSWFD